MLKSFFSLIILAFSFSSICAQMPVTSLVKGTEGMTPIAYYELLQKAEQSFASRDYAKAAVSFDRLTKAYPFDGGT